MLAKCASAHQSLPMQDETNGVSTTTGRDPATDRLDSWKQIAAYLGRGVTTVQRWEAEEGLPVQTSEVDFTIRPMPTSTPLRSIRQVCESVMVPTRMRQYHKGTTGRMW